MSGTNLVRPTFRLLCVDDPYFLVASSRMGLQAQITALSTSQSSSSTEVDALKHRVEDTEREKRDLVGVVSRLKEDSSQREGERPHATVPPSAFSFFCDRGNSNPPFQS